MPLSWYPGWCKMSKNYAGVEDLLTDESFLAWHFRADTRSIRQWDEWIAADPLHRARAAQAVEFLETIRFEEGNLSAGQLSQALSLLLQNMREKENESDQPEKNLQPRDNDQPRQNDRLRLL